MRTTLDLPDPLFREVKIRAVQQGVTLKDLLAQYIQAGMNAPTAALEPARNAPLPHPIPIAIRRKAGVPLTPALTNAELNAILDAEDLANHLRVTLQ